MQDQSVPPPKASLNVAELTDIFCTVDDFLRDAEATFAKRSLPCTRGRGGRPRQWSNSEVVTILIAFHLSGYRTFKQFYELQVRRQWHREFPRAVSYSRMVELMSETLLYLVGYLHACILAKPTGISFIDATSLEVCHPKRSFRNKVFFGLGAAGKTSMGWFFGFKLHLVINERGELLAVAFTAGNVDDRSQTVMSRLTKNLSGLLFGDKGYISAKLFRELMERGLKLVTSIRKNMKNKLMLLEERVLRNRRGLIESVNNILKSVCQIEHSRHRSPTNFFANLLAGLCAYGHLREKPALHDIWVIPPISA